ncbi:MAG: hypothetical protein IKU10_06000, partial [Clostridia bacterium]|nr:hypothetical protein [Clostridia bacterium]
LQTQHDSLQTATRDQQTFIVKVTIVNDEHGDWERREYIGYADGQFVVQITLDRHFEKNMYRVNGEYVSKEEYNEQLNKWEPDKTVELSKDNIDQLKQGTEDLKEELEELIVKHDSKVTATNVQTPTAETVLIDQYGLASQEQFVAFEGGEDQPYPSNLCGIVSIINADINNDETDELVVLRIPQVTNSQEVQMIAEVYQVNDNTPTLCASQAILHNIGCSVASNIYLFHSAPLSKHCIMIDSASLGASTGVNAWTATVYTVTIDTIEEYGNWESVPMVDIETDFESAFKLIGVPYAKNCTTYGSESSASDYYPLCEIEHEIFGDSASYLTRNHKLKITGIVPAVASSKAEGLTATDKDWDIFCDMYDAMMYGFDLEAGSTIDFKTLPATDIMSRYVVGDMAYGMYFYFDEGDFNPDTHSPYWENLDAKDESEYLDPLHKFLVFQRVNANTADWVAKNVFGATPDRNKTNDDYYYHGDKLYHSYELGGGPNYYCKITNTQDLGNGTYGITVDEFVNVSDNHATNHKIATLYFVASLQEDPTYGRYWRYEKVTLQATYSW